LRNSYTGGYVDPSHAADIAEFVTSLGRLRMWAGAPSFRRLAKEVGPLLRPPRQVPPSTIGDVFRRHRRRLDLELVVGIVRALGLGEREVAEWRAACVALHVDAKSGGPSEVFRQLPADLATFTGREEQLTLLMEAAVDGVRSSAVVISAIEGMGGVGKTRLAVHAAHRLVRSGRYTDVQLYVNLHGFDPELPPADPAAVLDAFLRQLGVPAQQIPGGLGERAAMFRDRLSGKDALILLDNASSEEQVRELIPGGPSCLVLITSRRNLVGLEDARLHLLDVFRPEEAAALLARVVGVERVGTEPAAAARIVEACGFLPLAVALAASRLRSRPAWSLTHLAELLDHGDPGALASDRRSLSRVFELSYRGLPVAAQRLFGLLGLFPGRDFTPEAVAALADVDAAKARTLLELLLDEHLLHQKSAGRFEFHDLVRAFAAELAEHEPEHVRKAATARVTSWYLLTADGTNQILDLKLTPAGAAEESPGVQALAFDTREAALAWFDDEHENLLAAVRCAAEADLHGIAWRLAVSQVGYFLLRHRLAAWTASHEAALTSARAIDDRRGQDRVLTGLGRVYRAQGLLHAAESSYLEVVELSRRRESPDSAVREATALNNLATVYNDQKRCDEAFAVLDQALAICREADYLKLQGTIFHNIAISHFFVGALPDAARAFGQAVTVHQQTGDRLSEVMAWNSLGDTNRRLADLPAALAAFEHTIRLSTDIDNLPYQGLGRLGRGDVLSLTGNHSEAREEWAEAHELFERIGHRMAAETKNRLELAEPLTA
jgi:tetratricopeptide (TPR) repeat protein